MTQHLPGSRLLPALAGRADNTVNVVFDAAPATLDAYKQSDRSGLAHGPMLYSGLIQKNQQTGEFRPAIASAYKFIDDKTLELTIRRELRFQPRQPPSLCWQLSRRRSLGT